MTVLVLDADLDEPGIHALVIGVGAYPYLKGGSKKPRFECSMGQLDAPPKSAEAFSQWLKSGLKLDGKELRRLDVLAGPAYEVIDHQGQEVLTDAPTLANVKKAAIDWKTYANSNEDNVAILFFCGHGLSVGDDEALLLEGFGDLSQGDHLNEAFNPSALLTGMQSCRASLQIYFFDACRNEEPKAANAATGLAGVTGLLRALPSDAKSGKDQAVFRSTHLGMQAYSTNGKASRFTEALIEAMSGAGSTDDENGWSVEPVSLQSGVNWLINLDPEVTEQWMTMEVPARRITLHQLPGGPIVPVMITCKPDGVLSDCVLEHTNDAGVKTSRNPPNDEPWHQNLPFGIYEFRAYDQAGTTEKGLIKRQPHPPKAVIAIKCE